MEKRTVDLAISKNSRDLIILKTIPNRVDCDSRNESRDVELNYIIEKDAKSTCYLFVVNQD